MANKRKVVQVTAVDKVAKSLLSMPQKQPDTLPIEAALEKLKPAIQHMIGNGYSRQDVIDKLGKEGLPIKLYQLKKVLANERKVKPD